MIAAIMQPTYLPWVGYFDLLDQSDVFVLLDTVAFSRQSWQQRNRILSAQGVQWLTVPVRHAAGTAIRDVRVDNERPWRRKHWSSIEQGYRKAAHWTALREALVPAYEREWLSLADLNVELIGRCSEMVGIETRLVRAAELDIPPADREQALVEICRALGATTYLSPAGSSAYLGSDAVFDRAGIALRFHTYEHPTYPQRSLEFVPHLSALDLLANTGPDALAFVRAGRRPWRRVDEM